MSTPVILITFAGRKRRMQLLSHYVKKALEEGIIDEWHIWDFSREASDREWLSNEFNSIGFMSNQSPYQKFGKLTSAKDFSLKVKCAEDFHIAITGQEYFYEMVLGGWANRTSIIRKVKKEYLYTSDRTEENSEVLWDCNTPGILSPRIFKNIKICYVNNILHLYVDGYLIVSININIDENNNDLLIRGGQQASIEFKNDDPIKRYVGVPMENAPYYRSYSFYSQRYKQYKNCVFLKCDDDIVYMDYKNLKGFIEFRKQQPHYFLVSANVLNNGYCAFLQQESGAIPKELDSFELPPYGFHGSLWESGEKAVKLHNFFLSQQAKTLHFKQPTIEWPHYVSINFISWLGTDLKYMYLAPCDDERILSLEIPQYLKRPHAFYSNFMVSHLSFAQQETTQDFEEILQKYEQLI